MNIKKNAHAKLNLFLEVGEKYIHFEKPYHKIKSEMALLELHAELTFDIEKSETHTTVVFEEGKRIYSNDSIIARTTEFWSITRGVPVKLNVSIKNPLPVQAGLGAVSSYAATTIEALEEFYIETIFPTLKNAGGKPELPLNVKMKIGSMIGSDIPFFISKEKRAIVTGIGDLITPRRPVKESVFLHFPDYKISTPEAYKELDERNLSNFIDLKQNKYYYEYLVSLTGDIGWKLSGSGSTFFVINPEKYEDKLQKLLDEKYTNVSNLKTYTLC